MTHVLGSIPQSWCRPLACACLLLLLTCFGCHPGGGDYFNPANGNVPSSSAGTVDIMVACVLNSTVRCPFSTATYTLTLGSTTKTGAVTVSSTSQQTNVGTADLLTGVAQNLPLGTWTLQIQAPTGWGGTCSIPLTAGAQTQQANLDTAVEGKCSVSTSLGNLTFP